MKNINIIASSLTLATAALLPSVALAADAGTSPAATATSVQAPSCHTPTEKEVEGLFDRWNASLQTGNPDKVVANYAQHSILLATVSNTPRLTPEQKEDYFHHFLENQPSGKIDMREIEMGCNYAVDAGLYTFTFGKTGNVVHARYTFTYAWDGKDWLITSHHSSAMPEKTGS